VKVTFRAPDGETYEIEAASGLSLMQVATSNAVPGLDAECGGVLSCATCHVHVDAQWFEKLTPASEFEEAMMKFVADPHPRGRLSCQIQITEELDGLSVELPETQ